jgi:hypothetical protein
MRGIRVNVRQVELGTFLNDARADEDVRRAGRRFPGTSPLIRVGDVRDATAGGPSLMGFHSRDSIRFASAATSPARRRRVARRNAS